MVQAVISMGSGSISAQLMLYSLEFKKLFQTPPYPLVWDSHIILLSPLLSSFLHVPLNHPLREKAGTQAHSTDEDPESLRVYSK